MEEEKVEAQRRILKENDILDWRKERDWMKVRPIRNGVVVEYKTFDERRYIIDEIFVDNMKELIDLINDFFEHCFEKKKGHEDKEDKE
jgi:hypothetical protein